MKCNNTIDSSRINGKHRLSNMNITLNNDSYNSLNNGCTFKLDVARLINQGSCSDKILKQHKRTRKSFKKGNCGLFNQQNKDNNSCTRVSDFNNFQQPAPAPTFVDLTYQAVCNILGVDQFKYGEENFFNILDKEDPYSPNAFDDEEEAKKILEKNDEILDDEIEKAFVDLGV